MFGRTALFGLVALAACGGGTTTPGILSMPPLKGCSTSVKPEPIASIGPDLTIRTTCGGSTRGAVASVSEAAGGFVQWTATIAGDPSLKMEMGTTTFTSCALSPPQVAFVMFTPPITARPGDGFDAVVTVRASGDAFPAGTVKVHGEVAAPVVTIDRDAIDFGDVAIDTHLNAQLAIRNESSSPVTVVAPAADANLPFHFDLPGFVLSPHDLAKLAVTVDARALGDYSSTAVWVTTSDPNINLPDGCTSMFTASFHVRVVLPDAGTVAAADAGTDAAADAGQDAAADAGTDAAEATAPRARAR